MEKDGGAATSKLLRILAASSVTAAAATSFYYHCWNRPAARDRKIIPQLRLTESGKVDELESFSQYVARQIGFAEINECPQLAKLANDYLRKSKGCEDNIYAFFVNDPNADSLFVKLVEEFERCILSYFAFHWNHASLMISQVLSADTESKRKLKNMVMAATRKQRFDRVTKDLKVTRVFSTLVDEMKAIGNSHPDVMVPVAHDERSPVLLLMGGGMGAGKSTVLKDILKQAFWTEAAENAVVVEADAFKESDVIYRALSSKGHPHDMLQTAELVHQSSTDAASSLLVTALNEGRDVIMDGTLSWEPFVHQTIAMARNVYLRRYRMGVGYKVAEDGTVTENYWEEEEEQKQARKPYRIELVGVVCDAYLAVMRGIRRAIMTKRAVRVKSQLKSHKLFAEAFERYCMLVDNARLYCTNSTGGPPKLIGWKDGDNCLLVDPQDIRCLKAVSMLNENAESIYEVYNKQQDPTSSEAASSVWKDFVLSPTRRSIQEELKISIKMAEEQV
ncbi:PREDICTED: uncharacterized protein LOC104609533 [Nelumbo nucifera]|uniref:Zeta toxin domain-containing protein n=2 Tax=Nelumbo nucifera TaxID=4432 RepID=A0A822YYW7_NELNU|nr:PREDICTED: uncharacterized protein LOC104609533 [Nelumbo nucifera]DAD36681.1 TPA_asm: hypothetical protein HUJ06_007322 [Nelumbo nucifera]